MSLTVSQIIVNARDLLDDATVPSATVAVRMVNEARKRLAIDCFYNEGSYSYSSQAYVTRYALPSDVIKIKRVKWVNGTTQDKALEQAASIKDWEALAKTSTSSGSDLCDYFLDGRTLAVFPPLSSAAGTDALNGGINSSVTTIILDDASWLPKAGRIQIESEKIMFSYRDDTTLYGCTRGIEGTTAATHADDTAITELNIVIYYYKFPSDLTAADNIETVLELFPKALEYYVCWQAKIKDMDDGSGFDGAANKAGMYRALYEEEKNRLRGNIFEASDEQFDVREV